MKQNEVVERLNEILTGKRWSVRKIEGNGENASYENKEIEALTEAINIILNPNKYCTFCNSEYLEADDEAE